MRIPLSTFQDESTVSSTTAGHSKQLFQYHYQKKGRNTLVELH